MLPLALSLLITGLLLALPVMTWSAYKAGRGQAGRRGDKALPRLLAGCTIAAWAAQATRYALLASAQGAVEIRKAAQLSIPLGWLVWLAAVIGLTAFIIIRLKKRR